MDFNYKETEKIKKLLNEIEALRVVFEKYPTLPHIEDNLRRESLLNSALYSAKIEEITKDQQFGKVAIQNLEQAYRFINSDKIPQKLSETFVYKLHQLVLKNISVSAGKLRSEPWAIFNQAGIAVYLAPPHFKLPELMMDYIKTYNQLKVSIPVKAAIAQFLFEKIHPFADGNGRVGRLISAYVVTNGGYGFKGLIALEKYINDNRTAYYQGLEPIKNVTYFVEFYLEAIVAEAYLSLDKLGNRGEEIREDSLMPRRKEIVEIIKDHPMCSFDFLRRRFLAVNEKTLHNDLKILQKENFVLKIGKTRGSIYRAK